MANTQPDVKIQFQNDGQLPYAHSAYPIAGTRPSVGTFTVFGTVANGNRISIRSNTGIFGDTGPNLMFRTTLRASTAGQNYPITDFIGNSAVTYQDVNKPLPVVSATDMPYGKAIAVGGNTASYVANDTNTGNIFCISSASQKFFRHHIDQFPLANQTAALAVLDGTSTWQMKDVWVYQDSDGYSNTLKPDWYGNPQGTFWASGSLYWGETYGITTNDNATGTSTLKDIAVSPSDSAHTRLAANRRDQTVKPVITQYYQKLDTTTGAFYRRDVEVGVKVLNTISYTNQNYATNSGAGITTDRCSFPGFVRGFSTAIGAPWLFQDLYFADGNGAPARLELTDNATYDSSTKKSIFTINYWSASGNRIDCTVEYGCFYGGSIAGAVIHAIDKDNNHTGQSSAL